MTVFPINTIDQAPEAARAAMAVLEDAFGFIPNLIGAMSASPVLIESLVGLFGKVHGGSFSESEIQIVLLTNAVANKAGWAVALHSSLAREQGIGEGEIQIVRKGEAPTDPQLGALSTMARTLIETRGRISKADQQRFLDAGFEPRHLLELIAIIAASTITNYTANVTDPPLEALLSGDAWPERTS